MQEPMDNMLEARDEPTAIGMVHLPGINDEEFKAFRALVNHNLEPRNLMTMSFRTASEEAKMRDVLAQAADAEEEGPDDNRDPLDYQYGE